MTSAPLGAAKRVTFYLRSQRAVRHGVMALLERLKELGASQAAAFNSTAAFTAQSPIHSLQQVDIMPELPVIVVWIDRAEVVDIILPQVLPLVENGTVTVEPTEVVLQRSTELAFLPRAALVRDVMTRDVYTVTPSTPVSELTEQLLARGLRSAPVVDESRVVIGIVTNGDLVRRGGLSAHLDLLSRLEPGDRAGHLASLIQTGHTAADLMTSHPITVEETMPIRDAAQVMLNHHLKRLPVVTSEGRLVGIVSRVNLLRTVAAPGVEAVENHTAAEAEPASAPVSRIMTKDVPTVHEDAPVPHLVNVIISTRLNSAVVVDDDQHPRGIVTDAGLIARVTPGARPGLLTSLTRQLPFMHGSEETQNLLRHAQGNKARDFMEEDFVLASRDASIAEVLKQMVDRQKKLAVLTDGEGRIVGMVDRRDLLSAIAQ